MNYDLLNQEETFNFKEIDDMKVKIKNNLWNPQLRMEIISDDFKDVCVFLRDKKDLKQISDAIIAYLKKNK